MPLCSATTECGAHTKAIGPIKCSKSIRQNCNWSICSICHKLIHISRGTDVNKSTVFILWFLPSYNSTIIVCVCRLVIYNPYKMAAFKETLCEESIYQLNFQLDSMYVECRYYRLDNLLKFEAKQIVFESGLWVFPYASRISSKPYFLRMPARPFKCLYHY